MNIRYRNIVKDSNGIIVSGSAALVQNSYRPNTDGDRNKNHSQQKLIERLGKVVWIDEQDKDRGIFLSPSRGLVLFDLNTDEFIPVEPTDSRLTGTKYQNSQEKVHTSFGNTYLFFSELEKTPYMKIFRKAFPDRTFYQRIITHLAHDCLKNGSSIKCGEFLAENWLSYIVTDIPMSVLDCDSAYFKMLSDDNHKRAFFSTLVEELRKTEPDFGRACYVDSTPLPGEAENNPFNALCSHGTDGAVIQSRLVLVLDIQTCIPIWFEIIPSNVLDKSTILSIARDVKVTLDIEIDMYDLDAGYARKELFEMFHRGNSTVLDNDGIEHDHTLLVRMPATLGYPRDDLYIKCKPHFYNGRYSFDYEHHTFFGERVEINLFDFPEYAFVFIDKTQAESLLRGWREEHLEEWEALSDSAQEWYQVKDGFFVLIGNKDQTAKEALVEYRGRSHIETFFRDGKTYLKILPLSKWNKNTVKGKIFHDIMETILYRAYRKRLSKAGMSMSSIIVYLDSWECFKSNESLLELKTPRAQVRDLLEKMGYSVPGHMSLDDLRKELIEGIPMDREPITTRTKRESQNKVVPISPEEKLAARMQEQKTRAQKKATQKSDRAIQRANANFKKSCDSAEKQRKKAISKAETELARKLASVKRESSIAKAKSVYNQTITKAQKSYEEAIHEATSILEKAKEQAKVIYEQDIAECS